MPSSVQVSTIAAWRGAPAVVAKLAEEGIDRDEHLDAALGGLASDLRQGATRLDPAGVLLREALLDLLDPGELRALQQAGATQRRPDHRDQPAREDGAPLDLEHGAAQTGVAGELRDVFVGVDLDHRDHVALVVGRGCEIGFVLDVVQVVEEHHQVGLVGPPQLSQPSELLDRVVAGLGGVDDLDRAMW